MTGPGSGEEGARPPSDGDDLDEVDDVSLGELLREARRQRAITLADVERDTRINAAYIEALEAERYDVLPAPVYARGFLRSYAKYLGLDPDATLAMMPRDLPRPPDLEPSSGLMRGPSSSLPALPALSSRAFVALLAVALLVALAFFALSRLRGDDDALPPPPTAETDAAATAFSTATETATAGTEPAPAGTVPPFEVGETPNFIGVARDEATELLTQLGLSFVVIEVQTNEAPAGRVFGQSPQPGATIEAGGDVTLIVSSGPP